MAQESEHYIQSLDIHPSLRTPKMSEAWRLYSDYKQARDRIDQYQAEYDRLYSFLSSTIGVGGVGSAAASAIYGDDFQRMTAAERNLNVEREHLDAIIQRWAENDLVYGEFFLGPIENSDEDVTVVYGVNRESTVRMDRILLALIRWDQANAKTVPTLAEEDRIFLMDGYFGDRFSFKYPNTNLHMSIRINGFRYDLIEAEHEDIGKVYTIGPVGIEIAVAKNRIEITDVDSPCGPVAPGVDSVQRLRVLWVDGAPTTDPDKEFLCERMERSQGMQLRCRSGGDSFAFTETEIAGVEFAVPEPAIGFTPRHDNAVVCTVTVFDKSDWQVTDIYQGEKGYPYRDSHTASYDFAVTLRPGATGAPGETATPVPESSAKPPAALPVAPRAPQPLPGVSAEDVNRLLKGQ